MKKTTLPAAALLTFAILGNSTIDAKRQNTTNTLRLTEGATSPPAKLADVAWIGRHWKATGLGGICEEVWSQPLGNSMMGMFRLVKDGKVVFYELMTIAEENNSLVLKIKHFNPDMSGWEEKNASQKFPLVKLTPTEIFFNTQTYRRMEDGSLQIFFVMNQQGKVTESAIHFQPVEKWAEKKGND